MKQTYLIYKKNQRTGDLKYVTDINECTDSYEAYDKFKTSNIYKSNNDYVVIDKNIIVIGSMW